MLLINCAACAAPLAHDAPRCVRCQIRYCGSTCQHDHWRRGHKQICKKIHRGGGAEQYHADKKYKEAVAEAVEACAARLNFAEDTKGPQTCYLCHESVHRRTGEGLVRGCGCRGPRSDPGATDDDDDDEWDTAAGFVHVSCLAERVKVLVAEAEENNLGHEALDERWLRWYTCSSCKKHHHPVVRCALGWACWRTYLGRPEVDWAQKSAMSMLATALRNDARYEEARVVYLAGVAACDKSDKYFIVELLDGLLTCNNELGRRDDALESLRQIYDKTFLAYGQQHVKTSAAAYRYGVALIEQHYVRDALVLLQNHDVYPRAKTWQIPPDDADLQALSQEKVESELNRLIKCQRLVIDLLYTYYLSLWLYHFYGHEGYRKDLRDSAKGPRRGSYIWPHVWKTLNKSVI